MNLQKLFEMQRKLDAHIEKEHPRQEGEDRLAKKILALQVELGELANEWRGFKFWSHDQEPRYELYDEDEFSLLGDLFEQEYPLLEEYVDCLHFLLSIGLELHVDPTEIKGFHERGSLIEQFNAVFEFLSRFWSRVDKGFSYEEQVEYYVWTFKAFRVLGHMLGFKWEEIEQAYKEKNQVNHHRQEAGY